MLVHALFLPLSHFVFPPIDAATPLGRFFHSCPFYSLKAQVMQCSAYLGYNQSYLVAWFNTMMSARSPDINVRLPPQGIPDELYRDDASHAAGDDKAEAGRTEWGAKLGPGWRVWVFVCIGKIDEPERKSHHWSGWLDKDSIRSWPRPVGTQSEGDSVHLEWQQEQAVRSWDTCIIGN